MATKITHILVEANGERTEWRRVWGAHLSQPGNYGPDGVDLLVRTTLRRGFERPEYLEVRVWPSRNYNKTEGGSRVVLYRDAEAEILEGARVEEIPPKEGEAV